MISEDKVNILVVDDRKANLTALAGLLAGLGQNLVQAQSGEEALKYLLEHDVAVILLDVDMPGMDGFQTAKFIRERPRSAHVPIIFITAADRNDTDVTPAYALGGVDYIFKPVNPYVLRSKVSAFVDLYVSTLEIKRQNEFVTTVLNTIGSLVLVLDQKGRILRANRAWEETMGFSAEHVAQKAAAEYMRASEPGDADFFARVCSTPEFEDYWVTRSGDVRRIHWRCVQCQDVTTETRRDYYVVTGIDVTERTRLEQERRARTEDLEGFTYSVSHDLRAPIRAIDGFTRIITEEYSQQMDDEGRRLLQIVRLNTHKMGELIDGLLALSRIGREPMRTAEIDMVALARAIFEDQQSALGAERSIEFKLDESMPPSSGDRRLIAQVFENLISNAIKFTRDRKPAVIEVRANQLPGQVVYFVRDNGVGFDMNYSHKLFGTFQRLHAVTEFEGTGIGLATVRRVIERHGGSVWAESEEGRGATFYFSLPRQEMKKAV